MAKIISIEEVVVDRDGEILEMALAYHKDLCGCHRTDKDELAIYIERVTEIYDGSEDAN